MLSVRQVPKCLGRLQTLDLLGDEDEDEKRASSVVASVVATEKKIILFSRQD